MSRTISVQDLYKKCQSGEAVELIDVRTPAEFESVHAQVAKNCPIATLDPKKVIETRACSPDAPLYVICRSGSRSAMAVKQFHDAGYRQVVDVEGGTLAWQAAGLPVEQGQRKVISVDRQMRIIAGSLVLTGVWLALTGVPQAIYLSAFIGAGLVFAGVTDICPMMKTLSLMPWNQGSGCKSCSE